MGTLVHDALLPGKRLWFLATGTGIAPFASLMRDPETYEKYDQVIMMHTCREVAELDYGRATGGKPEGRSADRRDGGGQAALLSHHHARAVPIRWAAITDNLTSRQGLRRPWPAADGPGDRPRDGLRLLAFNVDVKAVLEGFGLREGANSEPQEYVVEKAFVGDGI